MESRQILQQGQIETESQVDPRITPVHPCVRKYTSGRGYISRRNRSSDYRLTHLICDPVWMIHNVYPVTLWKIPNMWTWVPKKSVHGCELWLIMQVSCIVMSHCNRHPYSDILFIVVKKMMIVVIHIF